MSKELTLNLGNLPAHLRAAPEENTNEFGAGIRQTGLGVPILSIRGKEFRFRHEGQEYDTGENRIDVILLASRPHVSKRFFGKQDAQGRWEPAGYTPGTTSAPVCFSTDGVRPSDESAAKQCDRCSTCPWSAYGSKVSANGKKGFACDDYKRLVVLPVMDDTLNEQVVVLDLPFTSLKKNRADKTDTMFLHEFTGALVKHGVRVPGIVTTLKFTGAEYPQVGFSMKRAVTEAEWVMIQELRESEAVQELLADEAFEPDAPITEVAAPAPKPEPKAEAKPNLFGGKKAKTETAPPPEPEAEPEAEPEPETAPTNAADAAMADIRKLLGGL